MKKLLAVFAFCLLPFALSAAEYNAVLVADMDTGKVLYSENANDVNYPASLTKIMTLYLTFDALEHNRLNLDDHLIVSQAAANAAPVKLGLTAGSKIKVEDAIKAVAVHSANDVARVLAENLKGGKEGNFASLMTQVATEIGLSKTNFENSSGLPDDDHLSSARDIALLSMAVYKHFPQYWKYFGIKSWTYNGQTFTNGNRLLGSYPGCNGMKTGYTNKSRYSLVATASRDGRNIMAVVLGASNKDIRATTATRMLDKGFAVARGEATPQNIEYKVQSPKIVETKVQPQIINNVKPAAGSTGVQFGAFSSRAAAETQAAKVQKFTGLSTTIEPGPNGTLRVRTNGLSESAAQNACTTFRSGGGDCYVFH
ncbi:MAG: D-alanyl-D-alanine carboxypeptidase [Alphaproteobacteria bacterium]|nr:D-alanyl-D-alanine carboxypeptidase [Alphaproteobacteria bacterium]